MTEADVKRALLRNAYENNKGSSVAFIDESYLAPSFSTSASVEPFYLMTAFVIPVADLAGMRADVVEVVAGDYWHSTEAHREPEGRFKIIEFAEYLGEGSEPVIVSLRRKIDPADGSGETARRDCMRTLLAALASGEHCEPISLAVFEERKHMKQRNADQMTVKGARSDSLIPRTMQVHPASPTHEKLLWIPDVVSFALYQLYGAVRTDYAEPFVERVVTIPA